MVLPDPDRMHAERVGIERLCSYFGNELVGLARVVQIVIVAEREVTEIHRPFPRLCGTTRSRSDRAGPSL